MCADVAALAVSQWLDGCCRSPVSSGGSTAVQLQLRGHSRGDAPLLDRPASESQHSHEFSTRDTKRQKCCGHFGPRIWYFLDFCTA
jgi:hypothetical protein